MRFWPPFVFGSRRRARGVVSSLLMLDRQYCLPVFKQLSGDLEQDLTVLIRRNAFDSILVELRSWRGLASVNYRISASGLADPVVPVKAAVSQPGDWSPRVLLKLRGEANRNQGSRSLRLPWRPTRSPGDMNHPIPARDRNRRRLYVVSTGQRGYAFAKTADSGEFRQPVFLHVNDANHGLSFSVGQYLTAELFRTSEGWQGKKIKAQ